MQIRVFTLPLSPSEEQTEEMNHFLRSHRIIEVRKELASVNGNSVWSFCVTYLANSKPIDETTHKGSTGDKGKRVDYKEILEPIQFERFAKMRKLRKQIADSEAIPAYAVFTDAELAEMARLEVLSANEIGKIPGIGKKKSEKYASAFVNIDNMELDEKSGVSDGTNS